MKENVIKWIYYSACALMIGVLAFFIMYNVGWIIGDDAIVINRTGWGHFFHPTDTITPSSGRFFPLAYFAYNILPLLGLTSVNAHFTLLALVFILFCLVSFWAAHKAINAKQFAWQDYMLAFFAGLVCIARAYCNFLDAYSTIWVDYTLVMIWALCSYYVHKNQSLTAMIVGLLSVTWLTYCLETNFIFPLAYGITGLLFMRKDSSKLEKAYHWSLVGVGIIFLLFYFFICFLYIEEAYDGAHGSEVTILGNAIKMFIAQKVLWVVLILVCWRAYRIIVKKEMFEFWDIMLLTGCAYCCGCAVMKLNWVLYYSLASLFMVPAIVHYLHKYFNGKWACIVMLALALFTFRKVPGYIKTNQDQRKDTAKIITTLTSEYKAGNTLYWYAPIDDREWCYDFEQREWLYSALMSLFTWTINNEDYVIPQISAFKGQSGIYISPRENLKQYPGCNDIIISQGMVIKDGGDKGLSIIEVH